jgi:restriction endonuclease S subunit
MKPQEHPELNFDQLALYPFSLAPLPEQRRIVTEVERRLSVVAALEQFRAICGGFERRMKRA